MPDLSEDESRFRLINDMILYKYRSFEEASKPHTIDVIRKRDLYFSNPDKFNDPFEFRPVISLDATKQEFANYLDEFSRRQFPFLSNKERRKNIKAIVNDKSRNYNSPEVMQIMRHFAILSG